VNNQAQKEYAGYDFWLKTTQEFEKMQAVKQEEFLITLLSKRKDNFNLQRVVKMFNINVDPAFKTELKKTKSVATIAEEKQTTSNSRQISKGGNKYRDT